MAETWWTESQAVQFLTANHPFEMGRDALDAIERMLEKGKLPARWRRPDETTVLIAHHEWRREARPPGSIPAGIEWSGYQREIEWQDALGIHGGRIEVLAAPLRAKCTPEPTTAAPAQKRGRSPKGFVNKLAGFAGAWLAANGLPDTKQSLADAMRAECERRGWEYGDTQIRAMAAEIIEEYEAAIKRDL